MPDLVAESTDAAFATKFRQALSGQQQKHIPRTEHVNDAVLASRLTSHFRWPSPARARFLVKVAMSTVCRRWYLVRKSTTLEGLEQALRNPAACDLLSTSKLFALFALGEVYSSRASLSENEFPGIDYYSDAARSLQVLTERPRIDCVETLNMLVGLIFCLAEAVAD